MGFISAEVLWTSYVYTKGSSWPAVAKLDPPEETITPLYNQKINWHHFQLCKKKKKKTAL